MISRVLLLSAVFGARSAVPPHSCDAEPPLAPAQAPSLLQVSNRKEAVAKPRAFSGLQASHSAANWLKLSHLSVSASSKSSLFSHSTQPFTLATKGQARAILPPELFNLGVELLQNEDTLDAVVANTDYHNVTYAGENLSMRLVNGEGLYNGECCFFGTLDPDVYALGSLGTLSPNEQGMLDMMDVGGNVGVVSVAAFKKEPKRLRVVAVEPVPSTYFLFVWNLWLNGVPRLSLQQFQENPAQPGVLAFNKGVSETDNHVLGLCYTPPYSMNSKICDCAAQAEVVSHQPGLPQCANVVSSSFGALLALFPNGGAHLAFLKMDCEGCENDLLPGLTAIAQNPAWKLGRLAGELHAAPNAIEDLACKFEGGNRVTHVCWNPGNATAPVIEVSLTERCSMGAARTPCTQP